MQEKLQYEAVIGLEVHAQLSTVSKLFSTDGTLFEAEANTQVSTITLAHPGTLPVMNEAALASAVKLGLALNCTIQQRTYFARKNYFYPDLPKGYQVSQDAAPICTGGKLEIDLLNGEKRTVQLNRIHIEEDAGKSLHDLDERNTCLDYNRAGVPLVEIVTEPCIHSADEAFAFVTALRNMVRWLGVCDGNMEEGSMRCDANISIRPVGDKNLYTRVEVKNLNSIRNVKRAIELEVARLIQLTESGEKIVQETRSYNADDHSSFSLRSKEDAHDYRYFPEPDLPLFFLSDSYLQNIKAALSALPKQEKERLQHEFNLSEYAASAIIETKEMLALFYAVANNNKEYKIIANWLTGPVRNYCTERNIELGKFPLSAGQLSKLIGFTQTGAVHFNIASTRLMDAVISAPSKSAEELAAAMGLLQETDTSQLKQWSQQVLEANPGKVAEFKKGKKALLGMFAGEVKKLSKGKADMQLLQQILTELLNQ